MAMDTDTIMRIPRYLRLTRNFSICYLLTVVFGKHQNEKKKKKEKKRGERRKKEEHFK